MMTMNKNLCAITLMSVLASGAFAQATPPGAAVPPNTPGVASDKAQRAGEARKQMRPSTGVNARGGDMPQVAEGGAIGTDKAAMAGERRAETRDMRRPGKTKPMQGGTPK